MRERRLVDEEAPVVDPLPNYLQLVTGLTNATRARARSAARSVLSQVGLDEVADDASERITKLTEEIQAASKANREMLENLISTEVERASSRLGFVRKEDLQVLRAEVAVLRTMIELQAPGSAVPTAATSTAATTNPAKTTPARKIPAKKSATKKVAGAAAKKSAAAEAPAMKPAAEEAATGTGPGGSA